MNHNKSVSGILKLQLNQIRPHSLDMLADDLESRGYDVIRAYTSADAMAVLQNHGRTINLLVTDIKLPGAIDGWTIAEEARRIRPNLPVIYVTGFFSQVIREVTGGTIFMKPYRLSAIAQAAETLWNQQVDEEPGKRGKTAGRGLVFCYAACG